MGERLVMVHFDGRYIVLEEGHGVLNDIAAFRERKDAEEWIGGRKKTCPREEYRQWGGGDAQYVSYNMGQGDLRYEVRRETKKATAGPDVVMARCRFLRDAKWLVDQLVKRGD